MGETGPEEETGAAKHQITIHTLKYTRHSSSSARKLLIGRKGERREII